MERSTSQLATSQLDPLTVLRDTAARFRRKANERQSAIDNIGIHDPYDWYLKGEIYRREADRLDDLISLCDGTATSNASADTLPVAAETIDDASEGGVNEQT